MKKIPFKDYYKAKLTLFESYLQTSFPRLPQQVSTLEEAMKYSLFAGGKRLRPILTMTTAECGGFDSADTLPYACAIEYIHTYSLIHDDLPCMDNDDLRRGKPTNHIQFGEATALLAGDALLTHSFYLLSSASGNQSTTADKKLRIVSLIAEKAGIFGMVSGQVADTTEEKSGVPVDSLQFIHSHKTGALITASVQIGAILADYSLPEIDALTSFGEEIGRCFQIQDDILDETGNKERLGKTPGTDQKNNTLTYPKVFGLKQSYQLASESYEKAMENLRVIGRDVDRLKQLAEFILKRDH